MVTGHTSASIQFPGYFGNSPKSCLSGIFLNFCSEQGWEATFPKALPLGFARRNVVNVQYVRMSILPLAIASFGCSSLQPDNVFSSLHIPRRRRPQMEDCATVRTCDDLSASVSSGRSDISLGKNPHLEGLEKTGPTFPDWTHGVSCLYRLGKSTSKGSAGVRNP